MKTHLVTLAADQTENNRARYVSRRVGIDLNTDRREDAALHTEAEATELAARLTQVSGGYAWKEVPASPWIVDGAGFNAYA